MTVKVTVNSSCKVLQTLEAKSYGLNGKNVGAAYDEAYPMCSNVRL